MASLDLLVFNIEKNKVYPELEEGDIVIKSASPRILKLLKWLIGDEFED